MRCCRCCTCAIRSSRSVRLPTPTASSRRRRAVSSRERPTSPSGWRSVCEEGFGRSDGPAIVIAWPAVEAARLGGCRRDRRGAHGAAGLVHGAPGESIDGAAPVENVAGTAPRRSPRADAGARARAGRLGPTLPVAFAAVGRCGGIALRDALAGYAYTRLAATVSAAMRLVADRTDRRSPAARASRSRGCRPSIDVVLARQARPESFTPALDIAQMTPAIRALAAVPIMTASSPRPPRRSGRERRVAARGSSSKPRLLRASCSWQIWRRNVSRFDSASAARSVPGRRRSSRRSAGACAPTTSSA